MMEAPCNSTKVRTNPLLGLLCRPRFDNLSKPFGPQFLSQTTPFCLYPAAQAQFRAAQAEAWIQGLGLSAGFCRLLAPGLFFQHKRHLIVSGSKTGRLL